MLGLNATAVSVIKGFTAEDVSVFYSAVTCGHKQLSKEFQTVWAKSKSVCVSFNLSLYVMLK